MIYYFVLNRLQYINMVFIDACAYSLNLHESVLLSDRRDFPLVPMHLDNYQSIVQDNVSFL